MKKIYFFCKYIHTYYIYIKYILCKYIERRLKQNKSATEGKPLEPKYLLEVKIYWIL